MSARIADVYRRFAEFEAEGVSNTYFEWSSAIAEDPEIADLISELPGIKVQPNLVFAAARHLGAPVGPYPPFRAWLVENWTSVVSIVMARATQTNEAARCAVLLPVLSRIDGPLALIEAGASAGLCLYPDRYSYRYEVDGRTVSLDPASGPSVVQIPCVIDARDVPTRLPSIAWRAGADLNPIDPTDQDQLAWLETLVWPEHTARRDRLHAASTIAADDPPNLRQGDILAAIPELIKQAPAGAKVVVFHSAVLVYLPADRRQEFAEKMLALGDVTWVSNEGPGVFPFITDQVERPVGGRTILAVDGRPVALVGPHGQSYESLN
ncbi:DUF2332 domain-containing protein [Microbacterium lushaniae]|uniref:DUF2332 domain-containing protein n=1 Tax=Microbacterium lushaniae TaxID=2614639 RepID=A0A5J6L085_9MICO|nr:DUF2332 domain-containing protein [Microbacterium lushaniae]QEW01914.1 DUF2332 domain-containing protein [Microbacterium lushaniae]